MINRLCGTHGLVGNDNMLGFALAKAGGLCVPGGFDSHGCGQPRSYPSSPTRAPGGQGGLRGVWSGGQPLSFRGSVDARGGSEGEQMRRCQM